MKFDYELSLSNIPKEVIYFLYNGNDIVYIGQSINGLRRVLSHTDKDFDNIKMIICKNKTKRDRMEIELIWKHKPLYNKNTYENIKMIEDGFVNIETIRSALKGIDRYDITDNLIYFIKQNTDVFEASHGRYIKLECAINFLESMGIDGVILSNN